VIVPEEAEADAAAQVLEAQQNGQNTSLLDSDESREEAQDQKQTNIPAPDSAPEPMEDIVQAQDAEHVSLSSAADAATSSSTTTTAAGAMKRRQSVTPEAESNKRTRLSPSSASPRPTPAHDSAPTSTTTTTSSKSAPRVRPATDLARNRRLFGGLLSTLSASTASSTATHQRRLDIESRAAAKLALSSAAAEAARSERAAELWATRQREQERWSEYEMRVRHERVRAVAGSLETRTRPVLYWRPYELRGEERERIERQKLDAEEMVQREIEDFERDRDHQQQRRRRRSSPYSNGARQRRASSSDYGDENRPRPRLEAVNGHGNENGHGHGEEGDSGRDGIETPARRKSGDAGGGAVGTLGAGVDAPEPIREAEGGQPKAVQVEAGTEETPAREPGEDNEEMMMDAGEDAVIY